MATQSYAASVQGICLRITKLDENQNLLTGPMDSYVTSAFIRTSFTPEYEDGEEITEKAADGTVCVSYKAPDTLKRVNLEIAICEPDPEITALMSGGLLLEQGNKSVGWASAQVGEDPMPNGVAVEVWSRAVVNGKPDPEMPYFHWVFPYVKTRLSGDRVIENGLLATTFEGTGLGNINFRAGIDGTWLFPAAVDRPYVYARSKFAPTGYKGFYQWKSMDQMVPPPTPGEFSLTPPPGTPVTSDAVFAGPTASGTGPTGTNRPGFNVPNGGELYPYSTEVTSDNVLSAKDFEFGAATGANPYPSAALTTPVKNPAPTGSTQPGVTYNPRGDSSFAKGAAVPGATYDPEPSLARLDGATMAASLVGLGYVAKPTSAWTTGQKISIGSDDFYWDGVNWKHGAATKK